MTPSPQRRKALSTPPVVSAHDPSNMSSQRSQSVSTRTQRPSVTPSYKRASYQQNLISPSKNVVVYDEALEGDSSLLHENEHLRRECLISEELLAESQKDNEKNCSKIEDLQRYIKEVERLLSQNFGPSWQLDNHIAPPIPETTTISASTPLPKPAASLRHSTSITFSSRRSSSLHRRGVSVMDFGKAGLGFGPMLKIDEQESGVDDTPTGALRRLEGGTRRGQPLTSETEHPAKATSTATDQSAPFTDTTAVQDHVRTDYHASDKGQLRHLFELVSSLPSLSAELATHTAGRQSAGGTPKSRESEKAGAGGAERSRTS